MKKPVALLLAIMLIFSLSACGEKPQTEQSSGKDQTQSTNNQIQSTQNDVDTDTEKEKTNITTSTSSTSSSLSSSENLSVDTVEELEDVVSKDVEGIVNSLSSEWETLSATIITYDDYVKNAEKIEEIYKKINIQTEQACIRLQEYAVKYAEMIMSSNMSNDDKYGAFDDLKDCIYDDASEDLKDGIYDDLLGDMQDTLYEGALDDSDDAPSYSDWYDVRSDEYENWYDTRSDVYENWYDTRSDIYSFYYDMRGELWSDDIEKAEELLEEYKEDVEKMRK